MQTPPPTNALRLTFCCKDPDSTKDEDCPTFYRTNRGTWIIQGDRREEDVVTSQLRGLKPSEGAVEVPEGLIELLVRTYVKERYGIDLDRAATESDQRSA